MTEKEKFLPFVKPFIDEGSINSVVDVLRSGWLTGGPKVREFENALSSYCGGRVVRTFNSGTSALTVALRLAGVGPGDEVITTPLTWVATANTILEVGAKPIFSEIDYATRNIDLSRVLEKISKKTKAIIPVDLAGLPVDRVKLNELASCYQMKVIEDAAQSFGSNWQGQAVGCGRNFVAFSFHANKNLTTGEGGALVLPDDVDVSLCERLRLQGVLRDADGTYDVSELGYKLNLSDVAAAVGLGQLRVFDKMQKHRLDLVECYFDALNNFSKIELPVRDFSQSNWHMFQILIPRVLERGRFVACMKDMGIGVGVHYPAVHLTTLYKSMGYYFGDFPVAEDVASRIVTLPLFHEMNRSDVMRVCDAVEAVLG